MAKHFTIIFYFPIFSLVLVLTERHTMIIKTKLMPMIIISKHCKILQLSLWCRQMWLNMVFCVWHITLRLLVNDQNVDQHCIRTVMKFELWSTNKQRHWDIKIIISKYTGINCWMTSGCQWYFALPVYSQRPFNNNKTIPSYSD